MEYIGTMGAFARNYSINCSFTNSWESMNRVLSFCVFVNCCQCRYFCHDDVGKLSQSAPFRPFWPAFDENTVCHSVTKSANIGKLITKSTLNIGVFVTKSLFWRSFITKSTLLCVLNITKSLFSYRWSYHKVVKYGWKYHKVGTFVRSKYHKVFKYVWNCHKVGFIMKPKFFHFRHICIHEESLKNPLP